MNETKSGTYPRHDENPKVKQGEQWLLQYAKTAYYDAEKQPDTMFFRAATKYQELRDIYLGKGSVDKYKPYLGLEEGDDESLLQVDLSSRPITSKFLDIYIEKILQRQFRISATPIDSLAKSEMDKQYAQWMVKILMRNAAKQAKLDQIMQSPELMSEPGDPEDLEELEMKKQYNMKLNFAIEAEQGVELINYQNNYDEIRRQTVENWAICGVAAVKEYIDLASREIKERDCDPSNMLVSFCRKRDFSDAVHIGELREERLVDLSQYFTAAQMEVICNANKGRFGNPGWIGDNTAFNSGFDGFKAQVLDLEIMSDDVIVYEKRVDKRGNIHTNKGKWEKRNSDAKVNIDGKEVPKFTPRTITNIYRVKWVVGTDFVYDCGLAHDMKREPSKKLMGRTDFSYHIYAPTFDNMRAESLMERMRPLYDDYMITHFKLQNLRNRMIPNGWAIDLDALETVTLEKGGAEMHPKQVLDMFFQSGILVYRGSSLDGTNPNRKPIEQVQNSYGNELTALTNELIRIVNEMRDLTGLNEVTDGSTPSDRMLNGVASLANQSTNNALGKIIRADKWMNQSVAKGVIQRLQICVKNGDVEGIVPALGEGTVRHIKVTNAIAPHVWGIMILDIPTDEERQMLLQQLNLKDANGQIEPEDVVTVYNIHNIKEARQYLAYKTKKRKQEAQQAAAQQQQQNTQSQIQSAQAAELEKRKTIKLEYDLKLRNELRKIEEEKKLEMMKLDHAKELAAAAHGTTLMKQMMSDDTKAEMADGKTALDNDGDEGQYLPQQPGMGEQMQEEPVDDGTSTEFDPSMLEHVPE